MKRKGGKILALIVAFVLIFVWSINVSGAKTIYDQVLDDFEIRKTEEKLEYKKTFALEKIEQKDNASYKVKIDTFGNLISVDKLDYLYSKNANSKYISKDNILKMLYEKKYISKDYFLHSHEKSFNNVDEYIFIKKYANNLENFYDSIKVFIKNDDNTILGFNRFQEFTNPENPKLSESEAKSIAKRYIKLKNCKEINKIDSVVLKVKDADYLKKSQTESLVKKNLEKDYYTIFDVGIQGVHIFIDAIDGNILGEDTELSKSINLQNAYYLREGNKRERAQYLGRIMRKLGYPSQSLGYEVDNTNARRYILNYISNNNKYAFTFSGHGNTNAIGTSRNAITVTTTDVINSTKKRTNPWRFVFLDACSTAVNTKWMNSFKIYPNSSKKLFMGWNDDVYANETLDFMKKFCYKIEGSSANKPIGRLALEIKFEGSERIRLGVGGDLSWNGRR